MILISFSIYENINHHVNQGWSDQVCCIIKMKMKMNENYRIDFRNSGNFGDLLGFDKTNMLTWSGYGKKFSEYK